MHHTFHRLTEFATGLLFGLGLIVAGMTDPSKVIGFLDLAGFCPGPAIVSLGAGNSKAVVFVLTMLVGMAFFEWAEKRQPKSADLPR